MAFCLGNDQKIQGIAISFDKAACIAAFLDFRLSCMIFGLVSFRKQLILESGSIVMLVMAHGLLPRKNN